MVAPTKQFFLLAGALSLLGWGWAMGLARAQPGNSTMATVRSQAWLRQAIQSLQNTDACPEVAPRLGFVPPTTNRYALAASLKACLLQLKPRALKTNDRAVLQSLQAALAPELATLDGGALDLMPRPASRGEASPPFSMPQGTVPSSVAPFTQTPAVVWQVGLEPVSPSDCQTVLACLGGLPSAADTPEIAFADSFELPLKSTATRLQYTRSLPLVLQQEAVGVNAEASLGPLGLFGRYRITVDPQPEFLNQVANEHHDRSWVAGVGLKNFLAPQAVLALTAGQPFLTEDRPVRPTNFGAFYRFPLTQNLTITPTITLIRNPLEAGQSATVEGAVKATFSF